MQSHLQPLDYLYVYLAIYFETTLKYEAMLERSFGTYEFWFHPRNTDILRLNPQTIISIQLTPTIFNSITPKYRSVGMNR